MNNDQSLAKEVYSAPAFADSKPELSAPGATPERLEHLRQHGFVDIALLGDSGGNQDSQAVVAARLNEEWRQTPVRVHHLTDYYPGPGDAWLIAQGEREEDVGSHAGMHDTASFLFLDPSKLRRDRMERGTGPDGNGVSGHPGRSTAAYGEQIIEMQIDAAVRQIERLRVTSRR